MNQYNPLKEHADYLRNFWVEYGGGHRWLQSSKPKEDVIKALLKAGDKYIFYSIKGSSAELRNSMRIKARIKFDKVKDIRHRYMFKTGYVCLACGNQPNVRHHIIWLKNGGRNNKLNISYLCNPCHALIHPWLKKS
jgi:hypothetical protein